jgi:hypothetical protein
MTGSGDDVVVEVDVDRGASLSLLFVVVVVTGVCPIDTDSSFDSLLDNVLCKLRYFHDGYGCGDCCNLVDDNVVPLLL